MAKAKRVRAAYTDLVDRAAPSFLKDVTLAVLAGGEGARMGQPKAQLRIGERWVLEYLLDRFAWPGPTLLVTAPGREHPPGWERFSQEAVDPLPGFGPLCGVLTALRHATTPMIVIAAVDMPGVESRHLRWLAAALRRRAPAAGLMLTRQDGAREWIEPFPAVFRVDAASGVVAAAFNAGQRSLRALVTDHGFAVVPAPGGWNDTAWLNLNDPAEFAAFARTADLTSSAPIAGDSEEAVQ